MGALTDACQLLLDHVDAAYTEAGVTDAPERRYISPGSPPADCELVAVWAVPEVKVAGAGTDPSTQRCSIIPRASLNIASWLCVPTGTPPDEAALNTAGARVHDQLWAVWSHLADLVSNGNLHDALTCTQAQLLNAVQIEDEEGAYTGWRIPILIDLNPLLTDQAS